MKLTVDHDTLAEFERTLDTLHPEKGSVPVKILGFGEISLVFEIINDKGGNLAYKRLPIFDNEAQVTRHINAYNEYNRLLQEDVGLHLPAFETSWTWRDEKKREISLFCIQEKLNPDMMGHKLMHQLPEDDVVLLVLLIMRELKKIWSYTKVHPDRQVGIDGQISNWAVQSDVTDPAKLHITPKTKLLYIDTSTPMYRVNGEEAMEPLLFLKSAPSFLRWVLKLFFLKEVVDRYYDWRLVAIDLIANFYKEQKPEWIPRIVQEVNKFFSTEAADFQITPITQEEVQNYYKSDKQIWVIFQNFRQFDRFLQTKILRRKYPFYLPPKIKR